MGCHPPRPEHRSFGESTVFPQKRNLGPWIVGLVVLVFAFQNPEKAAHLVTGFFDSVQRFAAALGA